MAIRWYVWLLAWSPALLGVIALSSGVGDMRSSGLLPGVGLSILLTACVLALRGAWRRTGRVATIARRGSVAALAMVGVLGLLVGVPEFLQVRFGWFEEPDAYGLRAVVAAEGALVAVGHDRDGAVVVRSTDGRTWQRSALGGLAPYEAVRTGDGMLVVGASGDGAKVSVATSRDGRAWRPAGGFVHDVFGVQPVGVAQAADRVVLVGSIYGNDTVFAHSRDGRRWTTTPPEPVFDDGESVVDVACRSTRCVAVGERYRIGGLFAGDVRRGVAWASVNGEPWLQSDGAFGDAVVHGVTATTTGFVAVGHDAAGSRAVVWTSRNGHAWTPVTDQPALRGGQMDGVAVVDGTVTAFGRGGDALVVWTRDAGGQWERETVDGTAHAGSRIRAIASDGTVTVAVGVDAASGEAAIWTSRAGGSWRRTLDTTGS